MEPSHIPSLLPSPFYYCISPSSPLILTLALLLSYNAWTSPNIFPSTAGMENYSMCAHHNTKVCHGTQVLDGDPVQDSSPSASRPVADVFGPLGCQVARAHPSPLLKVSGFPDGTEAASVHHSPVRVFAGALGAHEARSGGVSMPVGKGGLTCWLTSTIAW